MTRRGAIPLGVRALERVAVKGLVIVAGVLVSCNRSPSHEHDETDGDASTVATVEDTSGPSNETTSTTNDDSDESSTGSHPAEPLPFEVEVVWRVTRDAVGGTFAQNVVWVGDVDGDGIGDLAVTGSDAGVENAQIYVVFGKEDLQDVRSEDIEAGIGGFVIPYVGPVAAAGDVDGDGRADILVGTSTPEGTGPAYVVFGKPDGSAVALEDLALGEGGVVLWGAGAHVAGGYDVDADGFADVLVGPGPGGGTEHFVVFGGADLTPVVLDDAVAEGRAVRIEGEGRHAQFLGDVDGDGHVDVGLSDPRYAVDGVTRGAVYVIFGRDQWEGMMLAEIDAGDHDVGILLLGRPAELAPSGVDLVSAVGDVDGDGLDDLIIAEPSGLLGWERSVVLGSSERISVDLSQEQNRVLPGLTSTMGSSPFAVVGLGDLDGDGLADLARTQPEPAGGSGGPGVAFDDGCLDVLLAGVGAVSTWSTHRVHCGDRFGASLAAGDMTGDNRVNLLATNKGALVVYRFRESEP